MLDQVEVRNQLGALLTLPLQSISNGFIVDSIEGLDPVDASVVTSTQANFDGELFQVARRDKRTMVFNIAFAPDYDTLTVESLRRKLYDFFMPKSQISIRFVVSGQPSVEISCIVESFNAPKFAKDPSASISVVGLDVDFIGVDTTVHYGTTNASTIYNDFIYPGSEPTGIFFRMTLNRAIRYFTLYNQASDGIVQEMAFELPADLPFPGTNHVTIDTRNGRKTVYSTTAAGNTSRLYAMDRDAQWIQFKPGINRFRVSTAGAGIPYAVSYKARYGAL